MESSCLEHNFLYVYNKLINLNLVLEGSHALNAKISPTNPFFGKPLANEVWRDWPFKIKEDFYFFKLMQPLTVSVKEKGGNLIETIPPSLWFKKSIQKTEVSELSRLGPKTSMKVYVQEFGLRFRSLLITFMCRFYHIWYWSYRSGK